METFEHCIYRDASDTRRFELRFDEREDGACFLLLGIGFLTDPMLYSTYRLGDMSTAKEVMRDWDRYMRDGHMTYTALPLEEVV